MIAAAILGILAIIAIGAFVIAYLTRSHESAGGTIAVGGGATLLFVIFLIIFGHTIIQNQHVGIARIFGVVQPDTYYTPGFHLKSPFEQVSEVDTAVNTMLFSGTQGNNPLLEGLTADQVLMHVDLAVTWQAVPDNVPAFKRTFGTTAEYDTQVYSIIRSAVRDVLASTKWRDGAIQNPAAFAEHIKAAIEHKTLEFFQQAGMGKRSASMVRYGAVNLRQIVPPDQIQQVNNDMAAAEVKEQLQLKLQRVEESARQTNEARAQNTIALVRVPAGMTPNEYSNLLHAMNERMSAETIRDAIASGKAVNVVVGLGTTPQPTVGVK